MVIRTDLVCCMCEWGGRLGCVHSKGGVLGDGGDGQDGRLFGWWIKMKSKEQPFSALVVCLIFPSSPYVLPILFFSLIGRCCVYGRTPRQPVLAAMRSLLLSHLTTRSV